MARRPEDYRLSRRAEADLESIYDYTLAIWSRTQADKYYGELAEGFEELVSGRRKGRDAGLGAGIMKSQTGSHVVFYRLSANGIDILRVLHQSMDAERHFKP